MIYLYIPVENDALKCAASLLPKAEYTICDKADNRITHVLLPVPSKGDWTSVLQGLPRHITIIGGNLNAPEFSGYKTIDLLQDPYYLAGNAAITAYCAIAIAASTLPVTLQNCRVLVIGWGRIGKCLAKLLKDNGAKVTVSARKDSDRAMLQALGYSTQASPEPEGFRLIFNTVPEMVLPCSPEGILKIDLASQKGIAGEDVLWARGLPNRCAPESSGILIAKCILSHTK